LHCHLAARLATTQRTYSLKQKPASVTVHAALATSTRANLAAQRTQSVHRVPMHHDLF
jgi:hypothetical protein